MRALVLSGALLLAACTEQAWFTAAKTAACNSDGAHHGANCAQSYSDDYRAMKHDAHQQESR